MFVLNKVKITEEEKQQYQNALYLINNFGNTLEENEYLNAKAIIFAFENKEKELAQFSKNRTDFIFKYNQDCFNEGYNCRIEETEDAIYALENNEILKDGEVIVDPDYETKKAIQERERLNKLSLTKREVFLALYKDKGITPEQIKAQITDPEALIEFEYANDYFRGNPLIETIGTTLGYTTQQLDYLFENKKFASND